MCGKDRDTETLAKPDKIVEFARNELLDKLDANQKLVEFMQDATLMQRSNSVIELQVQPMLKVTNANA